MLNPIQLHCVTDDELLTDHYLLTLEAVLESNIDVLQLRLKKMNKKDFFLMAKKIKKLALAYNKKLLINDNLDIAMAANADGIHLGQQDLPVSIARKLLGINKLIGLSINTLEQAQHAIDSDADYLSVSPLFKTQTKRDATPPLGLSNLKHIKKISNKPVIAIGGITLSNCRQVINNGADGIAVCSEIFNSKNVKKTIHQFRINTNRPA